MIHHPLGGASYYFKTHLIDWLLAHVPQPTVQLHVGAQLNSIPHMGNIVVFACAFALASELRKAGKDVKLIFTPVDTAPSTGANGQLMINGVRYQRSLRFTEESVSNDSVFVRMLDAFAKASGVNYTKRTLSDALVTPATARVLRAILGNHDKVGRTISPTTGKLGIRAACPEPDCGLADKDGTNTTFTGDAVCFLCPHHGPYSVDLDDMTALSRLEFNTPLRNLLRFTLDAESPDGILRVTGGDYAGFFQEQMLWRPLVLAPEGAQIGPARFPIIAYSPPILDWSGAKLSKSLYVKHAAYKYLDGSELEYMVGYDRLEDRGDIGPEDVYAMCREWIATPYKYFRSYSIYAVHELLMEIVAARKGMKGGVGAEEVMKAVECAA